MKGISNQLRIHIRNASIFVLGVIATILITKLSDKVVPNDPVIVKQYTDTVKIVHDYKIPENLNNDSTKNELERKLKNLELINSYDKLIKERLSIINNKNEIRPNLILTHKIENLNRKGYIQGSSSSFFSSNCPDLNSKYIDLYIDFINPSLTKEIAFLRVNIYRFDSKNSETSQTYILEDFYEVKPSNNIIRINNDFGKGKYEIIYGFIFKNDLNKEFPTFYLKKCTVSK